MAALPEVPEDLSAPAGGDGTSTPQLEKSGDGDVKMGGIPASGVPGGGKKKKKGKK
jgi:hypothetical protein